MELTILMPCLNEAESIGFCVGEAAAFLRESGVDGEVLVADNGSSDGSQAIARNLGARVTDIAARGYGSALRGGIEAAMGRYVIMADSDGSYDFYHLQPFLDELRAGADVVIGNRFRGTVEEGAFPWTHRCLGVPVLSWLGRVAGRGGPGDFHCGLRGVNRTSFLSLHAVSTGMEFASEMLILASRAGQTIVELPADLRRDHRQTTAPHLRAVPDGLRHIRVILPWFLKP